MLPVSGAMLLGMDTQSWSALGSMLLAFGALFGGLWALYNYHRTRRYEAARWLQGVFKDFYLSGRFKEVRELLEYDYPERAGPLLERRITDRDVRITPEEREILGELDNLLNYFDTSSTWSGSATCPARTAKPSSSTGSTSWPHPSVPA